MQNELIDDNISLESLGSLVERLNLVMKRKEILSHHSSPIKQLPNGRWYTRLGGRKIERKSQEDLKSEIIAFYDLKEITINYIFYDYLSRRKELVAETTWKFDILYYTKYILNSEFAKKPIKSLTLDDGYLFLKHCLEIKPDMRRKYWVNLKGCLDGLMQYCINKNYISSNPIEYLKPAKDLFTAKKKIRDCDTVFSKEEQIAVCNLAEKESKTNSLPLGIVLLFNLGLRIGELCAIKWGDIESNNYIHIQREEVATVNENGKVRGYKIVEHCKTDAGDRRLLLNRKAKELFEKIYYLNNLNDLPTSSDDYIFLRRRKGVVMTCTTQCFDPRLRRYCRESGMSVIKSPHDIRRTVLTKLYFAGMPLKKIQEFAGHSTLQQTMDYIRISADEENMMPYLNSLSEQG